MTAPALAEERAERHRSRWRLGLRLATPIVVLGLLWNLADGPGALALLGDLDWTYIVLALVAVNLQTLASAWRWHCVAARLGQDISVRQAVAEYYLSQVVNQSLPGGVLGDAARAVRARHKVGLGIAAKAVIIERLAGQIAMFSLLGFGLGWAMLIPGGLVLAIEPWQIAVAGAAVGLVALAIGLARRAAGKRWPRGFGAALHAALVADGAWVEQALLGVVIVTLNLASFTLCALATGTALGIEAVLVLVPLILCAMLIPASVAGWGFREGAAAALFPLAGATATAGFAASVAFGLVILAASLPGLLVLTSKSHSSSIHPEQRR